MGASSPSRSGAKTVLSEINVTPLVDVMLVLLIIFMITAPMMQQGLEVELPETASSGVSTSDEPFVLVIKKDRSIHAGEAEIKLATLKSKLEAIFATRRNKQVYLQADRAVDYGTVAEVMAEIRAAGIFAIGMITIPKSGAK